MKRVLLVLLLLVLIGAAAAFWLVRSSSDDSTAVTAGDAAAVVDVEQGAAADAPDPGARPAAGTYELRGSGSDHFSALGGASHTFPKAVSMVVELDADDDCAWTLHVVFVEEHVEEQQLCTTDAGAVRLTGFARTTEFLGRRQTSTYTCTDDAAWLAPERARRWRFTCTERRGGKVSYAARIVGEQQQEIAGEQTAVTHVRLDGEQDDDSRGSERTELWLLESGLPARLVRERHLTVSTPLGKMTTREDWDYALQSLAPTEAG